MIEIAEQDAVKLKEGDRACVCVFIGARTVYAHVRDESGRWERVH